MNTPKLAHPKLLYGVCRGSMRVMTFTLKIPLCFKLNIHEQFYTKSNRCFKPLRNSFCFC